MARAKSNAAKKYARNYKKISTRRMTTDDPNDSININEHTNKNIDGTTNDTNATSSRTGGEDEVEIERLRNQLRSSTAHLSRYDETTTSGSMSATGGQGGGSVLHSSTEDCNGAVTGTDDTTQQSKDATNGNDDDDDKTTTKANTSSGGDGPEEENEEDEMERLRNRLRSSTAHLELYNTITTNGGRLTTTTTTTATKSITTTTTISTKKTSTNTPTTLPSTTEQPQPMMEDDTTDLTYITDPQTQLILPSRKKTPPPPTKLILTPSELKQARSQHKATKRKLAQLEKRHARKKLRAHLYDTISQHALSQLEMSLMEPSRDVGKGRSKKEVLRRLLAKERAGVELTLEERGLLFTTREEVDVTAPMPNIPSNAGDGDDVMTTLLQQQNLVLDDDNDDGEVVPLAFPSSSSNRKKKKKRKKQSSEIAEKCGDGKYGTSTTSSTTTTTTNAQNDNNDDDNNDDADMTTMTKSSSDEDGDEDEVTKQQITTNTNTPKTAPLSFAQQMMAGLSTLKQTTTDQKQQLDEQNAQQAASLKRLRLQTEAAQLKNRAVYTPPTPSVLKTAAAMGLSSTAGSAGTTGGSSRSTKDWKVLSVTRPEDIEATRYNLPVSTMEYEIIDSIRNHSVTVLCSETGSGKSTQVPQFLYESGITLGNATSQGEDDALLIGITQPRRVAAVSTAKRVSYEMGRDITTNIDKNHRRRGNTVAYQTKYETAGLGPETRLKFMTDGILLQEIKHDLLLRKYAVVILDEAHERNLNTDVLLGLLSAALPLRQKAALEGSLPPLKLVIMSATLRVTDFTNNERLFAGSNCTRPNLVEVPGRTHPVTIHHNKATEVEDYEGIAFQKVCKIHRKLPSGGILLFLTGKQEIIRMTNRLRRSLCPKKKKKGKMERGGWGSEDYRGDDDVNGNDDPVGDGGDGGLRDMDDDEADGDLFQEHDDYDSSGDEPPGGEEEEEDTTTVKDDDESNIPKKVIILPLYSLLSVTEQARVFAKIPEGTRLIVIATNIAETSLTIPSITYVVDPGRQKHRNFHASTGVASYDVMWISKASADQRAGRAGRTGPGHCYRLYSSSVYDRQLDAFALPEVLTRPLEDVVLAMKDMGIGCVGGFPFPTRPDGSQLRAALKLLADIGCVDISNAAEDVVDGDNDGVITKLGAVIAKLPLGARYGKVLLISAQASVLDYGISMVSVLSESSPFVLPNSEQQDREDGQDNNNNDRDDDFDDLDEVDRTNAITQQRKKRKSLRKRKWKHDGGDILAGMLAAGGYSYAAGTSGGTESNACKKFCDDNGLNPVIMRRIQKMRLHLARLAQKRFGNAEGVAAKTGRILFSMSPPNRLQENLLKQAIVSGLLDNVARRSLQGIRTGPDASFIPRSAYFSCRSSLNEPLFIDKNSVLYSKDPRKLPEWICYDTLTRKTIKDGSTISTMKNVTAIDFNWLGAIAVGSKLLALHEPLTVPTPKYDSNLDTVMCSVVTKYGDHGWLLPPLQVPIQEALTPSNNSNSNKRSSVIMDDDSYRWFIRYLLEGKVLEELKGLSVMLNDDPAIITRKKPVRKVALIVSSLSRAGIDSASSLTRHWAEVDSKFLFSHLKSWIKKEEVPNAKRLWIDVVKKKIKEFKTSS